MSSDFSKIVQKASLPAVWSQGVTLARGEAVVLESESASEATLRVRAPGAAVPPTVTLYLEDGEWSCDCTSKVDPCAHVAAAAIALAQGLAAKAGAPGGSVKGAPLYVTYDLVPKEDALLLTRWLEDGSGRREPVGTSLASRVAREPGAILASQDDLHVDRVMSVLRGALIQPTHAKSVFAALASSERVTLSGEAVRTSGDAVGPKAILVDGRAGGVRLHLVQNPRVDAVVCRGVVRVGRTLHPLEEAKSSGEKLERLPLERDFTPAELGDLVAQVLPELEKKLEVEIVTRRLPRRAGRMAPRVEWQLSQDRHALSVLPLLVYGDPPVARIDSGRLVQLGKHETPVRDEDGERRLVLRLKEELGLVPGRWSDFDGDAAARFATKLATFRAGGAAASLGEAFASRELVAKLAFDGAKLDLSFVVSGDEPGGEGEGRTVSGDAVLRAWTSGLAFVPLDGAGFAPLPLEWLSIHGQAALELLLSRDAEGKVARGLAPELARFLTSLDLPLPEELGRLRALVERFEALPAARLPADLRATLRPYQEDGARWLQFLRDGELGGILADDMGLGKTLQTLTALDGRALVVCPRSVLFNWKSEIEKFRPGLRVAVYHGPSRALDAGADVTLTTYAVLRLDQEALAAEQWSAVVLDEAQAIKNPESQSARAACSLRAGFRLALSGTPVENRLDELWSLMRFSNPGLFGGRAAFRDRFEARIAAGDAEAASALRARIKPFVLRRLKREVARDLPPRTDIVRTIELDERERATYESVRAASKREIVERLGEGVSPLAILEALLRLRQAACHPALLPGQSAESSSKVEALMDLLESATSEGHKVLVFSQWTSLLDLVEPKLRDAGLAFGRIDGTTRDREAVVSEFQSEAGPPVLLLSLKAAGTGLNLTAADHVVLLDPWWNPAAEDQAADRAHRIGQDRPVMVYRLAAKDTVEEAILALQERKRAVADAALGEAGAATAITRDDLMALLD